MARDRSWEAKSRSDVAGDSLYSYNTKLLH